MLNSFCGSCDVRAVSYLEFDYPELRCSDGTRALSEISGALMHDIITECVLGKFFYGDEFLFSIQGVQVLRGAWRILVLSSLLQADGILM